MRLQIHSLACGNSGSGKSFYAATFPRSFYIASESGTYETIRMNPELEKNIVEFHYLLPKPNKDIKDLFTELDALIIKAHDMFEKGLIDTLVIDNITYLTEYRWMFIEKYQKTVSKNTGNVDTQSMYGTLGRWLFQYVSKNITSFGGNVIMTCHIKQESEEALKKAVTQEWDVVPDILGGFRNTITGMFSLVVYLNKLKDKQGKYVYVARTDRGNGQLAKNRYNLPETMENISYQTILSAIQKQEEKILKKGGNDNGTK